MASYLLGGLPELLGYLQIQLTGVLVRLGGIGQFDRQMPGVFGHDGP